MEENNLDTLEDLINSYREYKSTKQGSKYVSSKEIKDLIQLMQAQQLKSAKHSISEDVIKNYFS